MSAARLAYNCVILLLAPLLILYYGGVCWLRGKYRASWAQRLGRLPASIAAAAADARHGGSRPIWIHAVSVGELEAITPLVVALGTRFPARTILLSTATETAQGLAARKRLTPHVFYFPLDLPVVAARFVRLLQPELIILTETELWPNLIAAAAKHRARLALVNARISDRSFRGYLRCRPLVAEMLGQFSVVAAQTELDAGRLRSLGAPAAVVTVTGNLKFDAIAVQFAQRAPGTTESSREALRLAPEDRLWVAGSTHPGEEELLLAAHRHVLAARPRVCLLLAPRHIERAPEVLRIAQGAGFAAVLRTRLRDADFSRSQQSGAVIVLDTIGELSQFYGAAEVAFIGGSLVAWGGHNPLEALVHGVPVLFGPYTRNFREIVRLVIRSGSGQETSAAALGQSLAVLFDDQAARCATGQRGRDLIRAHEGAALKSLALLVPLVDPGHG
ncbi:MAG: 3-deoxy-D-manno-octulosonic acid transferase [Candidatus Schekmanbacteria bacterium]|nr:3-deoxy-D-manno-octulosonic acid transferase [Candidatus Schekmanbacteria bacterium]